MIKLSRVNLSKFSGKNVKELYFVYLLANYAETAYLSFQDQGLSNHEQGVQVRQEKVVVHTFCGCPGEADKTALVQELSNALIFSLRSYPGKISHLN